MENSPFVTVVMPVRNEVGFIGRSLDAVLRQDYPENLLEVLVVDGMSTDGTRELIAARQAQYPYLHLIDNPGRIVPTGLNRALARARGDVIIRVDGHCEIAPDYVRRCVMQLCTTGVAAVGGPIETLGLAPLSATIALAMSSKFGVGGAAFRTVKDRQMFADTVAFPAYTRAAVMEAGPYDEELVRNQDDEYNYRLREQGARILLSPDIHSCYYSRCSLRSLWRQYYQYGYWKVRVMQKHPWQMSARQFAPPALVAALLLGIGLAAVFPGGFLVLAAVMLLYAAGNLSASLLLARRAGFRHLRVLPAVFATLHCSYGLGFLVGLVIFWHRWGDHSTRATTIASWLTDGARQRTTHRPVA